MGTGATDWACTRDNTTGLTWEVKTGDGGLRDQSWRYSWYSTDTATNGGNEGSNSNTTSCGGTPTSCNTQAYTAAVNTAPGLCGFTDWRLPSARELQTLVHASVWNPAIDTTYFPNTPGFSRFWSASSFSPYPVLAWVVDFLDGPIHAWDKVYDFYVRLVRGGQF